MGSEEQELERKVTKNISLCQVVSCGGKNGAPRAWRQASPHSGHMTRPLVMPTGREKVVCLGIDDTALLLKCLDCQETFLVGGCPVCGNKMLRLSVEEAGEDPVVLERGLSCDRCGHITGRDWKCPCCGTINPYHLTLGTTEGMPQGNSESAKPLHTDLHRPLIRLSRAITPQRWKR